MPDWWWQFECSHIPTSTNLGSLDFLEQGAQQAYKKHNGGNGIARGVQVMSKWRGYGCTQCHDNYLTELLFCRTVLHYVLHTTHNYTTNKKKTHHISYMAEAILGKMRNAKIWTHLCKCRKINVPLYLSEPLVQECLITFPHWNCSVTDRINT